VDQAEIGNGSGAIVFSAGHCEAECSESAKNTEGSAGRIGAAGAGALRAGETGASFGGAATTAALGIAVRITFDLDLEKALEIFDALVELFADVDILPIAKQGAIRLAASRFATTLEHRFAIDEALGLAIDLAGHVGVGVARAIAAGVALRFAIRTGWRCFATSVAFAVARRLT
jgi:hypothetical protein